MLSVLWLLIIRDLVGQYATTVSHSRVVTTRQSPPPNIIIGLYLSGVHP
jgi:hypothetical protein